jgi:hypothetical protein
MERKRLYLPNHPWANKNGQIQEDRLIMGEHLGRQLCSYERVRHLNGDGHDNRLENLALELRPGRDCCSFEGCTRKVEARDLCAAHVEQLRRGVSLKPIVRSRPNAYGGNGEGWVTRAGYKAYQLPDHPAATKAGYVLEHRMIVSDHLGRPLLSTETVHHRNGDRLDNRLENLELRTGRHGKGQAVDDLVTDAVSVLKRYAPELLAGSIELSGVSISARY